MKSTVHIFGHGDPFDPESMREYIESDIFTDDYKCRYRHNLLRNDVTTIILSHGGAAYGHFDIAGWEEPTKHDIAEWPKTNRVYIVSKSHSYESPVRLIDLGIKSVQYGKPVDADMHSEILRRAGRITTHQAS